MFTKDNEDMVENTHDINKAAIQDNNPVDIIIPIGVQRDDPRKNIYWTPCYQAKPLGNAHVIIVGQSGNGKSNLLKLLIKSISTSTDAPEKIVPSLVFDYHGELSGQGENGFLLGANANIVNPGMGIQINPLKLLEDPETKKKTSYLYSATMLGQTIGMAFELTNLQIGTLEMAIINVYKKAGFTENPETWELPVPPFKAIAEELEYMSVEERGVGFVLSKLRPLFINNIFRGDGRSGIEDLFTRTTVIRLNALPNLHLRSALVTLILIQLYEYMINQGPTRRLRCAVVADECHKLAKVPIFGDCYRELRKYGVSMIGASQRLTDFNPDILGNTATIIGMKMMADDSFRFAKELGTNNKRTAALLQRLGVGEAVIRNNAYYPFEVVKITRV